MASTNPVVAGTGPDTTLNLSDPASVSAGIIFVGGLITASWPGHNIDPFIQHLAALAAFVWPTVVIAAKHYLAGQAVTVPAADVAAAKVATDAAAQAKADAATAVQEANAKVAAAEDKLRALLAAQGAVSQPQGGVPGIVINTPSP